MANKNMKQQVMNGIRDKVLTLDTMNQSVKNTEYVILGSIVLRAMELERELQQGVKKPFTEIIHAYKGDAHAMGQKPITFMRQVRSFAPPPQSSIVPVPSFPRGTPWALTLCHSLLSHTHTTLRSWPSASTQIS
uniref:Uncharacterized protein n=1 Tax=Vombatus ursinus TaxID=29139 RepID=A0A4X2JSQ5_VOMUR